MTAVLPLNTINEEKNMLRRKTPARLAALIVTIGVAVSAIGFAQAQQSKPDMQKIKQLMGKQIQMMTPEYQKKVKGLAPQTKKLLMQIYSQHTRHTDRITLRHVMLEVLNDYNGMVAGIVTDNPVQAADSARRLANHRIPRGGLIPYLRIEDINDEKLSVLSSFNDSVEGNAKRLAQAADDGEMVKAASYLSDITAGCVGCHNVFRDIPGTTNNLK